MSCGTYLYQIQIRSCTSTTSRLRSDITNFRELIWRTRDGYSDVFVTCDFSNDEQVLGMAILPKQTLVPTSSAAENEKMRTWESSRMRSQSSRWRRRIYCSVCGRLRPLGGSSTDVATAASESVSSIFSAWSRTLAPPRTNWCIPFLCFTPEQRIQRHQTDT